MARSYTMTAGGLIGLARTILGDTRTDVGLRNSDAVLLGSLNEALSAMVALVPGMFPAQASFSCVHGYLQEIQTERAAVFQEVMGLPEADAATVTQFEPGWITGPAGQPENWMRVPGDPLRFMVYPPAAVGSSLVVRFAQAPLALTSLGDVLPIPEHFGPSIVEYIVARAELNDDEHVNSGRAAALLERFASSVRALGV